MNFKKIKLVLYFGLSMFLMLSMAPNSIAEEELNYELLLAESDTIEGDYGEYEDDYEDDEESTDEEYSDYEEDTDEDDAEKIQAQADPIVEKASDIKPPKPLKVVGKPAVKKSPVAVTKPKTMAKHKRAVSTKKYKGKFRRLKRDCNMRSIASVSGKKMGIARKRKKLWTQQIDQKWIEVQRKAGPAYINKSCF